MIARDEPYCLFLDELNAAPPDVQKAFYSLILDRRIGSYELPAGLHRDRRGQPGHRQRARPPDRLRAGQPPRPRAPAGERGGLAGLGGRGTASTRGSLDYLTERPDHLWSPAAQDRGAVLHAALLAHALGRAALLRPGARRGRPEGARARHAHARRTPSASAATSRSCVTPTASRRSSRATPRWPSRPEDRDLLYYLAEAFRGRLLKELPRGPRARFGGRPADRLPRQVAAGASSPRSPSRSRRPSSPRTTTAPRAARLVPGRGRPRHARAWSRRAPMSGRARAAGKTGPGQTPAAAGRAPQGTRSWSSGHTGLRRHRDRRPCGRGDVPGRAAPRAWSPSTPTACSTSTRPARRARPSGPGRSRTPCSTSASATSRPRARPAREQPDRSRPRRPLRRGQPLPARLPGRPSPATTCRDCAGRRRGAARRPLAPRRRPGRATSAAARRATHPDQVLAAPGTGMATTAPRLADRLRARPDPQRRRRRWTWPAAAATGRRRRTRSGPGTRR